MNTHKTQTEPITFFISRNFMIITASLALIVGMAGCATSNHREESVITILDKENALIDKLKLERSHLNFEKMPDAGEEVLKAEKHLLESLDELRRSNEAIQRRILKRQKKEARSGDFESSY